MSQIVSQTVSKLCFQMIARAAAVFVGVGLFAVLTGCSVPKGTLYYGSLAKGNPVVVVASGAATGPQAVVAYDTAGAIIEVLIDTTAKALIPKGLARRDAFTFAVAFDSTSDLLALGSVFGGYDQFAVNSNFNGVLYQMALHDLSQTYWVIEGNTIEAFDKAGNRIGSGVNPAIATTVGACVLSTPRALAVDQNKNRLIVTNSGTGYTNIYDISNTGAITCVTRNFGTGANTPVPVLLHSTGLLYIGTQAVASTRLWAMNADGSGVATSVLFDSARTVLNNPTAMVELPDGSILVANEGTDQIDRFTVSGTNAATRVGTTPLIKDAFTPYVNDMIVIKGL